MPIRCTVHHRLVSHAHPSRCLPRPLKPPALARGGDSHVKHRLADAQVTRDPCIDLRSLGANLVLLQTGPGQSPTGASVSSLSLCFAVPLAGDHPLGRFVGAELGVTHVRPVVRRMPARTVETVRGVSVSFGLVVRRRRLVERKGLTQHQVNTVVHKSSQLGPKPQCQQIEELETGENNE